MSRNLVYFFNGRFPTEKAHGIQIAKMCEAFTQSGLEVTLVAPFRRNMLLDDAFEYYVIKHRFILQKTWAWDSNFLWERFRLLGYYAQTLSSLLGLAVYLISKKFGPDTIFYARDYSSLLLLTFLGYKPIAEIHDYRLDKPRRSINWLFSKIKKIVVNSAGTRDAILRHYAVLQDRFLIAPNGVDPDLFAVDIDRQTVRQELGFSPEHFVVGYAGRSEAAGQDKGLNVVRRGFEILQSKLPNAVLSIVGAEHSVPYRSVPKYLKTFDIAVLPLGQGSLSRTTAPIKLFEYLAAGCCVLAADAPVIREYVDETSVAFFDVASPEHFAHSALSLAGDLERRTKLSRGARQRSLQYSWLIRARKIVTFIQQ